MYGRVENILSKKQLSKAKLLREYRCSHCGGRPVEKCIEGDWIVVCGRCGKGNLIHEYQHQRQEAEAQEVLEGLSPEMQELFEYEKPERQATINNVLHHMTVDI